MQANLSFPFSFRNGSNGDRSVMHRIISFLQVSGSQFGEILQLHPLAPNQGHLAMSGDNSGCLETFLWERYWHLVGRDQGCC